MLNTNLKGEALLQYMFKCGSTLPPDYMYYPGHIPVLLMAHSDSVLSATGTFTECGTTGIFISVGSGPAGFDDKCGMYCIARTLQELESKRPHVLITGGEESGGVGATCAVLGKVLPKVKLIIQFDRKGYREWVSYSTQPKQVQDLMYSLGYIPYQGSFSDSAIIADHLQCAHVNLSCGFFKEHTREEWCSLEVSESAVTAALCIIKQQLYKDLPAVYPKKKESLFTPGRTYSYFDFFDDTDVSQFYKSYIDHPRRKK